MKKYGIVGGVGLIIVIVIALFMFDQQKLPLSTSSSRLNAPAGKTAFLDYVPAQLDQMVYMHVDAGLIDVLEQSGQQQAGFRDAMQGVNQLAAIQQTTTDGIYSVLLIDALSESDIAEVESIGLIVGGADFDYELIGDNIWAYGDPISLGWYDSVRYGDMFTEVDQWEGFVSQLGQGGYNMAFVSTPGMVNSFNPMVMQFAQQLEHTMALSHLEPGDIRGEIIIQFVDGVVADAPDAYLPELAEIAPSQSVVYLELQGLPAALAITKEQFTQMAPLFFGQYNPALASLLSSEEYSVLYDVLSDNIAIVLSPQQNMFGLGASLYFAHPDAFALMEKLSPFWGALADGILGSGALAPLAQDEGFAFGIEGLPLFGDEAVLQLTRNDQVALISILGLPTNSEGIDGLTYSSDTLLSFIVDGAGLTQQLQSGAGGLGSMLPVAEGSEYISGQTIIGDIQMLSNENQLRLGFTVSK